jgi:hypothetical protein
MKHPQNLKRVAAGLIDDEVRENPVEKNITARKIGAAVPTVGDASELVKTFEEFRDDPISRLHAALRQKIKPDGVDIQDGVFSELE